MRRHGCLDAGAAGQDQAGEAGSATASSALWVAEGGLASRAGKPLATSHAT